VGQQHGTTNVSSPRTHSDLGVWIPSFSSALVQGIGIPLGGDSDDSDDADRPRLPDHGLLPSDTDDAAPGPAAAPVASAAASPNAQPALAASPPRAPPTPRPFADIVLRTPRGAVLTMPAAIALLHNYCAHLTRDSYYVPRPFFEVTCNGQPIGRHGAERPGGAGHHAEEAGEAAHYTCRVRLPPPCPLHGAWFKSREMETMRDARRHAAFMACRALYEAGLLSDRLMPVTGWSAAPLLCRIPLPSCHREPNAVRAGLQKWRNIGRRMR